MVNKKETTFYKNIRDCIKKYLTVYSENDKLCFKSDVEFLYGNSGFRGKFDDDSDNLLNAVNMCGIFLGLLFIKHNYAILKEYNLFDKSQKEKHQIFFHLYKNKAIPWKNVGIILTASHNPHDENGVKIIDHDGSQIKEIYEDYLNDLVNSHLRFLKKKENCAFNDIIDNIIDQIAYYFEKEASIDIFNNTNYDEIAHMDDLIYYYNLHNTVKANVCIGFDTRDSGIFLNNVLIDSLHCLNIKKCINNMCYITTPCMQFVIYYLNHLWEDERIDKVLQNKEGCTFHKKKNDLIYLDLFCLKQINHIKELYFNDTHQIFQCSTFSLNNVKTISDISTHLYLHFDTSDYHKETNTFHIEAYNNDQLYFDYFSFLFQDLFHFINENFENALLNNYEEEEEEEEEEGKKKKEKEELIYVDCSNGIAGLKLDKFTHIFQMLNKKICKVNCLREQTDILNHRCGSDYLYSKKELPVNFSIQAIDGKKCCSFDGDADRILYFYVKKQEEIIDNDYKKKEEKLMKLGKYLVILDGAKIICLFFKGITHFLSRIKLSKNGFSKNYEKITKLNITIISTAYANSAYINFLKNIEQQLKKEMEIFEYIDIKIKCAKTGIKHLERIAKQSSIGIFFEPNGHGTIYVNIKELNDWAENLKIVDNAFFITLRKYLLYFSQTSGDAIIDFIMIELTLKLLNMSLYGWDNFYTPLPSFYVNVKCKKSDLQIFETHQEGEHYLIKPKSLQKKIDEIVQQIDSTHGRCFVRPSGTENLIRVFAEAETSQKMQEIIDQVKKAVEVYIGTN